METLEKPGPAACRRSWLALRWGASVETETDQVPALQGLVLWVAAGWEADLKATTKQEEFQLQGCCVGASVAGRPKTE